MIALVLAGIVLVSLSGVPGLFFPRASSAGEKIAALLMVAGCACGLAGAASGGAAETRASVPWAVPGASLTFAMDGLANLFLVQIFAVGGLAAVYALGYWPQAKHPGNGRKLRFFFGLMIGGMALQVLAADGLTFLLGFEVMANAAFLVITTEDHDPAVRRTGLLYTATTHCGALCLFALFTLLKSLTGAWDFAGLGSAALTPGVRTAVFLLALGAFTLKAGAMPLHVWLPSAHANAPSHISAVMSGVLIETGIYGFLRIVGPLSPAPLWWGATVLAIGAFSAVWGIAFAVGQKDLKRLLAYSSIENMGIIFVGVGIGMMGRAAGRPEILVLGLAGALLHVWNHGLFKSLLFFAAGSTIHGVGTREIDRMGGVSKRMPWTAAAFLVGVISICGLPPLNGFVSEFLIYSAVFRRVASGGARAWLIVALAGPALALAGGLALAAFTKAYGLVFLGSARTREAGEAHESPRWMLAPMGVLAAGCVLVGVAPLLVAPVLDAAVGAWAPEARGTGVSAAAPLGTIGLAAGVLLAAIGATAFLLRRRIAGAPSAAGPTWGCGYLAPGPRMQYTPTSFGELVVRVFRWALWPVSKYPGLHAWLPRAVRHETELPDVVLDRALLPATGLVARAFRWFRWMQAGSMPLYIVYIVLTLVVLLTWQLAGKQP